ncbi:uncharacterized protein CCR75_003558 [Bremia lactucae]|uniref:Gamma-butyrobetaine hydroxylase-like N-terminal domain-containing protein n=1 Tax=Bremia lactucae TaxID=4779 RepID=A0A976IEP5_BRELC|nr:hypothetical protein CCR75_003558 [Bremia lactucae]
MLQDLRIVDNDGIVSCRIESPSAVLMEMAQQWKNKAELLVSELEWVKATDFKISKSRPRNARTGRFSSLTHVSDIIAVSSCKGGVGKSTVAVNLAYRWDAINGFKHYLQSELHCSLSKFGARVGILDADIYGPSLPTMVSPANSTIRQSKLAKHLVEPVEYEGVKCMSFGFVNRRAAPGAGGVGAAVMRGPMVSKLINQLIIGTEWGDLDYLVVDMPPGTGDIQISLSQQMAISAAVVVTTPQRLSFIDVEKGIAMFNDLKIKTVAVVENMSYFDCLHGQRHQPFGPGHTQELVKNYNIKHVFKLPISEHFSSSADSGRPFVLSGISLAEEKTYESLATTIAKEIVILKHKVRPAPEMNYDRDRGIVLRIFNSTEATEALLHPADLRARCRCAECIDEFTGSQILNLATIPDDIYPTVVEQKGNYAIAVTWSDGHSSSLYTYDELTALIVEFAAKSE